jgi:hypothetical protein
MAGPGGVELLRDIRDLSVGLDRFRSEELVNKLVAMVDRPWPEMPYSGKSITQTQVARLLKPYGVKPDQVRFGELTFKGFKIEWFEDNSSAVAAVRAKAGALERQPAGVGALAGKT